MKPKKLLQEIKNLDWKVEVRRQAPGVYVAEATRPNYPPMTAVAESDAAAIVELNRLVRWHMAGRYLRKNECITTINVGVGHAPAPGVGP